MQFSCTVMWLFLVFKVMPEVSTNNSELKNLHGLHLWHAPMSSCSQRVRIALCEANKDFTSHLINLEKGEHASQSYQAIHPNGVVPALVDNGRLFIESIDIIQHVTSEIESLNKNVSDDVLSMADEAQSDLKLLTFEFLFKENKKNDKDMKEFQQNHKNEWLKQFYKDFNDGFETSRIEKAIKNTLMSFTVLNEILADGRAYISGKKFTLSDIAWMPNVHRFSLMGWPFEKTQNLNKWFDRISNRPSYQQALLSWQNKQLKTSLEKYTSKRRANGTDISTVGNLN